MGWDWKYHNNSFTYTKEQIVRLAGWYRANKKFGHGFSTALRFAVAPADENENAIWPNARIEDAPHIVEFLEIIKRIDDGESKIRFSNDASGRINYVVENWIREGLGIQTDPELDKPRICKPDFILELPEDESKKA